MFILVGVSIDRETEGGVLADEETDVQEPEEYRVILLNDDYTTMEFVVAVIMSVFHKDLFEATRVMLDVHRKGRGVVGTYTYDIAATKVDQVLDAAHSAGHPLQCISEPVE